MKKYLYSGALALAAILTLSACAKPKLDAKLSVNDIVYMSEATSSSRMTKP